MKRSISFWDYAEELGLSYDLLNRYNEDEVYWHNMGRPIFLQKPIRYKKYAQLTRLKYVLDILVQESNRSHKISRKLFDNLLEQDITVWRSGRGTYDSDYDYGSRKWLSFTATKERTVAFGKHAESDRVYNKRTWEHYWVLELTLPLKNILLFSDVGWDDEVIVSMKDAQRAKLIEQK